MYKKLRELRLSEKYTTKAIADKLGISKAFYCQIEHGVRRLSYDMAVRIGKVFNLKPDEIFLEDHIENKKDKLS